MINKFLWWSSSCLCRNVTAFDADLAKVVEETSLNTTSKWMGWLPTRFGSRMEHHLSYQQVHRWDSPWVLAKEDGDKEQLAAVMALGSEPPCCGSLDPTIHDGHLKCHHGTTGLGLDFDLENLTLVGFPENVTVVAKGTPIFPRLDMEEEIAYIQSQMTAENYKKKEWIQKKWNSSLKKDEIKFEDFDRFEIRVARSQRSGTRWRIRQIASLPPRCRRWRPSKSSLVSREFYQMDKLVGKKLQIVANLKPREMMKKYVSQGMILSAEHGDQLTV